MAVPNPLLTETPLYLIKPYLPPCSEYSQKLRKSCVLPLFWQWTYTYRLKHDLPLYCCSSIQTIFFLWKTFQLYPVLRRQGCAFVFHPNIAIDCLGAEHFATKGHLLACCKKEVSFRDWCHVFVWVTYHRRGLLTFLRSAPSLAKLEKCE